MVNCTKQLENVKLNNLNTLNYTEQLEDIKLTEHTKMSLNFVQQRKYC